MIVIIFYAKKINALGGPAVLSFLASGRTLIIAVEENTTVMDVTCESLLLSSIARGNVVKARSYAEAAGLLAAHRHGILFESLTDSVRGVPITRL